jgi:HSP20 family protein
MGGISMTTAPVEVKKTSPVTKAPAMPDAWQVLRDEMDRAFDRFGMGFGVPAFRRMFNFEHWPRWDGWMVPNPAMDITEDKAGYRMTAELPGMTEKDIEITVRGETVMLKGEKKQDKVSTEGETHLSERSYGAFSRSFTLPEGVDREAITASFANGVLTLILPKKTETAQPAKTIEVKVGETQAGEIKAAA